MLWQTYSAIVKDIVSPSGVIKTGHAPVVLALLRVWREKNKLPPLLLGFPTRRKT